MRNGIQGRLSYARATLVLTVGLVAGLLLAPPALAATIVVDSATDDGTGCTPAGGDDRRERELRPRRMHRRGRSW
jgi:hypothetical protein